ncbi:2-C-methyl-D-erythritol 4-phosphate cytidylyltransferase [Clostridia bacterium]|nr:2-C-methyl-D-erythritol 4-phosphate cytidylyltransferase [Clostridia bacterium]
MTKVGAIITSAGDSTRMSLPDGGSKIFLEIGGISVLERVIRAFDSIPAVSEIVITSRERDADKAAAVISGGGFRTSVIVAAGGNTRYASVKSAVARLSDSVTHIAIHDGARCFVSADDIEKVIAKAIETGAAVASCAVTDTVKYVESERIKGTIDRNTMRFVQTPQIFERQLYLKAIAEYDKSGREAPTDDSALLEYIGAEVSAVACSKLNIKITDNEDIALGEHIALLQITKNREQ